MDDRWRWWVLLALLMHRGQWMRKAGKSHRYFALRLGGEGEGGQGARERGRRGMKEASDSGDRRVDRAGNLGNQQS